MNITDILKRAQRENKDEREEQIKTTSFHVGWGCVSAVMLFVMVLRSMHNESIIDIGMLHFTQSAAACFYQYLNLRHKKIYLFGGIASTIVVILSLAMLLDRYGVL